MTNTELSAAIADGIARAGLSPTITVDIGMWLFWVIVGVAAMGITLGILIGKGGKK